MLDPAWVIFQLKLLDPADMESVQPQLSTSNVHEPPGQDKAFF